MTHATKPVSPIRAALQHGNAKHNVKTKLLIAIGIILTSGAFNTRSGALFLTLRFGSSCPPHSTALSSSSEDGFDALLQLERTVYAVIVSDLNMPRMSGFEFLSVVRRRFPNIPVIAVSGAFQSGEKVPGGVIADVFTAKTPTGALAAITVRVTDKAGVTITNKASVGATNPDPNPANNAQTVTTKIVK
jgi:CheY-like chemotaxis protein